MVARCAGVQIEELRGEYRVRMQTNPLSKSVSAPRDFTLAVHVNPGDTYEWSQVLLARASTNGTFELLTAAWERLLGYGRRELSGKTLGKLMNPSKAATTVAAILDHENMNPVEVTVRCRDGQPKRLRLHRRFDEYGNKMFIVAEERS
jgi:PAS domain S-box-containing protein